MFDQAVVQGNVDTDDMAMILAYGIYLRSGGTLEQFMELNMTDIQILLATEMALHKMDAELVSNALLSKLFRGDD